ncbi:MAG TPA: exonuclease domain-containing protein [Anaerolineae bacterium]|nr:WYL domain-containing protein [Ardenticatenia bacterium]MBK8541099.1 WYL domain-containing protein [Ardenticatenia bacterium]HQZ71088.1 exonuclease domain-containing protein [Anaerolineae bacterium]
MDDLMMRATPLRSLPWAVVDVETTGLSPERGDRVIEVAVLRVEPDGRRELYSALVNPGRPIDPRASAVNGIRDVDVADAPPFADLTDSLSASWQGAVLVAHNAPFDLGFLRAEFALAGRAAPDRPVVDTLGLARNCFRFAANNLGTVAQSLGVRIATAHRAGGDVSTTAGVLDAMLTRLEAQEVSTLAEVQLASRLGIGPAETPSDAVPEPLATAIREQRALFIRYRSSGSSLSVRMIQPVALRGNYLVAYCHLRRESRTFHIDRIREAWWPKQD